MEEPVKDPNKPQVPPMDDPPLPDSYEPDPGQVPPEPEEKKLDE